MKAVLVQVHKGLKSDMLGAIAIILWAIVMAGTIIYGSIIKDDKTFFLGLLGALLTFIFLQGARIKKLKNTLKKGGRI